MPDSPDPATTPPTHPPVAERRPVTTEHHGRTRARVDEYDWLRDAEAPDVRAHLEAENAWTQHRTAHLADLRERIFEEIRARTQETDLSVPVRNRGHWYYARSVEGREYGMSCRVPVLDPDDWTPPRPAEDAAPDRPALPGEEVLLDLDRLAEGHEFFSLGGSALSVDGRHLAYAVDVRGDERYTIRVRDLATGELLDDVVEGALGGATWPRDGDAFYYTTVDASWRPDKVWRHRLGTAQTDDELVLHETDARFSVGVGRTRTDRFVMVVAGSKTTTEYHLIDADAGGADGAAPELWCFAEREEGVEYSLDHAVLGGEDRLLVLHNGSGPDFELGVAAVEPTPREGWIPLLPHDPAVRLEDVDAFATHVVVHQRSGGLTQVRLLHVDDAAPGGLRDAGPVALPTELPTVGAGGNPQFDQPTVRLGVTSLAMPASIYDLDVRTRRLDMLKRTPVLGGHDPAEYEEHRLWATAPDGQQVPISVVCRRDARADGGPLPVLLYGYGAYEASIDPYFSIARLSLLDRGGAFAIAHVRGGGELGRRWYDDGKLEHKQNTFSDFVACARHLVAEGWTTPDRLVAEGASAGGLLVGAVANQAPESFGGIVAGVPFVDVLTDMLDASLPLTVSEYDEWGNPEDDPEAYDRIARYSPYDNVADLPYPPILAEASLHDARVLFVEATKWVARLRERAPDADVLLRVEMGAGHGGVSGRYRAWRERAFTLAWILERLGISGA